MLDIGCAEGWLTHWCSKYVEKAVGIEMSIPKVKRAIREVKDPNTDFVVASFEYLPFRSNLFDIIIWSEGPEHATKPEIVLNRLAHLLKENGVLISSTMGIEPPFYYKVIRRLIGAYNKDLLEWKKWRHVTVFTVSKFKKLISKFFTIEREVFLRPLLLIPIVRIQSLFESVAYKVLKRYVGSAWPGFGALLSWQGKRKSIAKEIKNKHSNLTLLFSY